MLHRIRKLVCAVAGAALCLSLGLSRTEGQAPNPVAPEKLIPAESVLYFTSDGMDLHDASWKKTAAYEALYSSGVVAFIEKVANWGLAQSQPESAQFARATFDVLMRKGFSTAVAFPPGTEGPGIPYAVVVVHHGSNLKAAAAQLVKEMTEGDLQFNDRTISGRVITSAVIPGAGGAEVGWWNEGPHLVIVAGAGSIGATLGVASGKTPDVTRHVDYQKLREGKREVTSFGWLDAGALQTRFGEFAVPAGEMVLNVKSISEALGLNGLQRLTTRSGFEGKACWTESTVSTTGERTGLLALADQKPLTLSELPPLPVDSTGFSAMSFDLGKGWDDIVTTLRSAAKLGPPDLAEQLETTLKQLPQELGLDVKQDFLDPLGNVICVYDDPQQGSFGFGAAVAISLDNPARFSDSLNALLTRLADQFPNTMGIVRTRKQGREIVTIQFQDNGRPLPIGISYVVDEKWLAVGLMPQALEAFLLRLDGKLPTAQKSPAFAEIVKGVPEQFTGLTVSDPRKTYGAILSWSPWLLSAAQMAMNQSRESLPLPFTAADLPPAEMVVRPLFPNVSVTTVDPSGIRTDSSSSLPSVPLLNIGGDGAATTGVAVALFLPAVQQAREAARRSQSKNNLKQLALAVHNYHDVFQKFPMGARKSDLKVEKRISWLAELLPYLDQAPLYNQLKLDKAWDDEDNQQAMKAAIPTLLNPGAVAKPGDYGQTHYVGIAGVGKDSLTSKVHTAKTGVFGYDREIRFQNITDGTSNTIMITEASKDYGPWGRASGSIRALTKQPYVNGEDGIGGPFRGGFHAGTADGAVRFISESIDPSVLEALSTTSGGEVIGDF